MFLGSASAQFSKERRKKAIKCLNKKVYPLAEDEEIFVGAAPLLLGKTIETKMKSHLESLKCLSSQAEISQNFQRGRPQQPRGSGYQGRGGGHGGQRRFQPYSMGKHQQWGKRGKENFQKNQKRPQN